MSRTPTKDMPKGIQWFKHFPVNFVTPYGPTKDVPTTQTIWNRLQTFNCELFQRPKVGVSELASSVQNNIESLLGKNYKLLNDKKIKKLLDKLEPLSRSLKPLEKGSGTTVQESHVVDMLKQFFKDDEDSLDIINEAFVIGSSLYTMAIQMLVSRAIFQDPEQYSRLLPMNIPGAKTFKRDPSVKGMKRFLVENIVSGSRGSTASKYRPNDLLAQLEAAEVEPACTSANMSPTVSSDEESRPERQGHKRSLFTTSISDESDDDMIVSSNATDVGSSGKKSKKKKRKRSREISHCSEDE